MRQVQGGARLSSMCTSLATVPRSSTATADQAAGSMAEACGARSDAWRGVRVTGACGRKGAREVGAAQSHEKDNLGRLGMLNGS